MKKILSMALAMVLFLGVATAMAEATVVTPQVEESLDWKLMQQIVNGSGLKLSASFETTGVLPQSPLDPAAAQLLISMLPQSTLALQYLKAAFGTQKDREELLINLLKGDDPAASFAYRSDGTLEVFSSSLLNDVQYGAAKGESLFAGLLLGGGMSWPGIERILFTIYTADNEWKTAVGALMKEYNNAVSVWLQNFTQVNTDTQGDNITTETRVVLPAAAIKQQMKSLLDRFYADEPLLALLRERFTAREAAAYLDPKMKDAFLSAINALPITENVEITRIFGKDGLLVRDDIYLPMGGAKGLNALQYLLTADEDGDVTTTVDVQWHPTQASAQGKQVTFTVTGARNQEEAVIATYTGRLDILAQTPRGEERLEDEACSFTLTFGQTDMAYNREIDKFSAEYLMTLAFRQESEDNEPEQTIAANVTLDSGSNPRSATRINASAEWRDDAGALIRAKITGASAAPWSIAPIDDTQLMRLDSMAQAELETLVSGWQQTLQTSLAKLVAQYFPITVLP